MVLSLTGASSLSAQGGTGEPAGGVPAGGVPTGGVQGGGVQGGGPPLPPGFEEIKEIDAAGGDSSMDPGLHSEVRDTMSAMVAMPMVDPSRIAPGGNGTLIIMLSLLDTTVIQAGAAIEVGYDAKQAPVTLAQWTIDPPKPGKQVGVFQGKPVYDDTGMIRIPIAVDATTKFGKYPVDLALQIPLHESRAGKPIGVYSQTLRAEIVVGRALPTPVVLVPKAAPAARRAEVSTGAVAPAVVSDAIGVELRALRGLVIAAGSSRSFDLTVVLPDAAYLMLDPDLDLPRVAVTGLPSGVVVRPGPAPTGEPKTIAGEPMEVVRDRYRRSITLRVGGSVAVGTYTGSVSLDYMPCTESECHAAAKLELPF